MSTRTKDYLLSQHSIAKKTTKNAKSSRVKFSPFGKSSSVDVVTLTLFVVGIALIFVPFILPDIGRSFTTSKIYKFVQNQELRNEIHPGQFKFSSSSGDTRPNPNANFYAVNILKSAGLSLHNETAAQSYISGSSLSASSLREIYQNLVVAKSLNSFQENSQSSKKLYDRILRLGDKSFGFRMTEEFTPSCEATFYAFESISELSKFADFTKNQQSNSIYSTSCQFVNSMYNSEDGGFRNKGSQNSTIDATYYALQILARCNSSSAQGIDFQKVETFILSHQFKNGILYDHNVALNSENSNENSQFESSNNNENDEVISTLKGLYSLLLLESKFDTYRTRSLFSSPFEDSFSFIHSYFNSPSSSSHPSGLGYNKLNRLEEYYHYNRILSEFGRKLNYGLFKNGFAFTFYLGLFALAFGIYRFIRPSIPQLSTSTHLKDFNSFLNTAIVFLIPVAILSLFGIFPFVQFLTLLAFSVFFGIVIFNYIETDTSDGLIFLIGFLNFFFFTGVLIFLNLNFIPEFFNTLSNSTNAILLLILPVFQGIVSAGVCGVTSYSTRISKLSVYYRGSVLGWGMGVAGLLAWSGGHGIGGVGAACWALVSLVIVVGAGVGGAWYYWEVIEGDADLVESVKKGADKVEKALVEAAVDEADNHRANQSTLKKRD